MSVDPSGHTTHIALEHCEQRPSPFAPCFDLFTPTGTAIGWNSGTPQSLRDATWAAYYDQWQDFLLERMKGRAA